MLSNAYFLAKFRFDTAENEPAKNCKILLLSNFPKQNHLAVGGGADGLADVLDEDPALRLAHLEDLLHRGRHAEGVAGDAALYLRRGARRKVHRNVINIRR